MKQKIYNTNKQARLNYIATGANTILNPIFHLCIEIAQLVHALLDGGTLMWERELIGQCMDWKRLHVILMSMVNLVDFLQYSKLFPSVRQIGFMFVTNQALRNNTCT